MPTFLIENVNIIPSSTSNGSVIGFDFKDCRCSALKNCTIFGVYGAFDGYGVRWGGSSNSAPVHFVMSSCMVYHWNIGTYLEGGPAGSGYTDWQGVDIDKSYYLAVDRGVVATSGPDNFAGDLKITNCHFNFRTAGVDSTNVDWLKVMNNTFLALYASGGTQYCIKVAINTVKSDFGSICDNAMNMISGGGATRYGYYGTQAAGASRAHINSNMCVGSTVGNVYPAGAYVGDSANYNV
jgi:hypothetical protein